MLLKNKLVIGVFLLTAAVGWSKEIQLNSRLPALDQPEVAPLHCYGKYPQLDEGSVDLGLSLARVVNGRPLAYNWVFDPGTDLRLRVTSPENSETARLVLTVWNWFGEPVAVRLVDADPVEDVRFNIEGNGTWMITLDAYRGDVADSLISRLTRSFSVFPDCSEKRKSWIDQNDYSLGSCFFPFRYYRWSGWEYPGLEPAGVVEKLAGLSARAGLSMLRIDYVPDAFGRGREDLRETVDILRRHDIAIDWKVKLSPSLFDGETTEFISEKKAAFDQNISALLSDYWATADVGSQMVELGNEPAHNEFWAGTYDQYVCLYKLLYERIHTANPDLPIIHGGACSPGADHWQLQKKDPAAFLEVARTQQAFYDRLYHDLAPLGSFWPYHFHGDLQDSSQLEWMNGMRQKLRKVNRPMRLFQTEGGRCAWRPDFESKVWKSVLKKFFYSWAAGDAGWLQYSLVGRPTDHRVGDGWGLLHGGTFAPRFQYGAWAAVADWFAGCRLEQKITPSAPGDPLRFVYIFNHPDGKIISCFSEEATPSKLHIHSDAEKVVRIDPMGNATEEYGATLDVQLTDYPQYILLKGAGTVGVQ